MTTHYSPFKTSTRRVLGDMTPNSLNSPSQQTKNAEPSEGVRARSPLKKATSHIPSVFADKENLDAPAVYSQGRKRGIEEVDEAEDMDHAKMLARGRDEPMPSTETRLTTAAIQRHTVRCSQFHAYLSNSQLQENNPYGLADPGSPTECATPSPSPEPMPASQNSNQSFSELLNYELCASQKSEFALTGEPVPRAAAFTSAPALVETKSRAERLRTRLRFGIYKVKTNQATRSGDDIISTYEATASHSSNALDASTSTALTSSAESIGPQLVPNITISSPRREPVFVTANLDPFRPIGKLGMPPVQFALPPDGSKISSRTVHAYNLSSSPLDTVLPQSVSPHQLTSPVKQRPAMPRTRLGEHDDVDIEQGADTAHRRLQQLKEQRYRQSDLTSSTVKGSAAEGLLELMTSRR
jgi:hypothetical protein